jgi:hypothetical protein
MLVYLQFKEKKYQQSDDVGTHECSLFIEDFFLIVLEAVLNIQGPFEICWIGRFLQIDKDDPSCVSVLAFLFL